jgi:hypothetical protein
MALVSATSTPRRQKAAEPSMPMQDAIEILRMEATNTHTNRDWKRQLRALAACNHFSHDESTDRGMVAASVVAAGECLRTGRSEVIKAVLEFLQVR